MSRQPIGLINRINYDSQTGCWNWIGAKDRDGYGKAYHMGQHVRAHRLAAMVWLGLKLKDERIVMHRCDNPACFNPKHLFIGTYSDNVRDSVSKRRNKESRKTHCPQGHAYDEQNTHYYRTGRKCRACDALLHRAKRPTLIKHGNRWNDRLAT